MALSLPWSSNMPLSYDSREKEKFKMRLSKKVAIVTGGGKGLGKAIALAFASEGASLTIAARTISSLEQTSKVIASIGGEVQAIATDIRSEREVQQMVERTFQKFGRIDILVTWILHVG
jgi:3-oxoacyl-[acyl-carrier protein] reductase